MAGKSPLKASAEQKLGLETLAASRDRGEADRARAVLLGLAGWTSRRIAEAFAVREDTVRLWRSDFMRFEALKASIAPGPVPVKTEAALRVCTLGGSRQPRLGCKDRVREAIGSSFSHLKNKVSLTSFLAPGIAATQRSAAASQGDRNRDAARHGQAHLATSQQVKPVHDSRGGRGRLPPKNAAAAENRPVAVT